MNCKYYRTRTKKYNKIGYCTRDRKEVSLFCKECEIIEYKEVNYKQKSTEQSRTLKLKKNKSSKLSKLERNRFSILTDNLNSCIICGNKKEHLHEVFPGAFRQRSMKENMVLPLCAFHHTQIHSDIELSLYWKRSCQKKYEESHTRDEFIKIFGRSYL